MELTHLIAILIGFAAGFVDAIAGGGGLIALPGLFFLGFPPHLALGTNKLQSVFGTMSAAFSYIRHGDVVYKHLMLGGLITFSFSVLGTLSVLYIDPSWLKKIIPYALALVFFYVLFRGKIFDTTRLAMFDLAAFYCIFGVLLGFYDGFFGPGTGSFWMFAFLHFVAFKTLNALATTKIMNIASNLGSICVFAVWGSIDYKIALIMAIGQILGGQLGAKVAIKKGSKIIRPFLLALVFITIIKTFIDSLENG